jgi:hypothetical protein
MGMGLLTDMNVKYGEYKIQTLKEMIYLAPQNVRFGVLCQRLLLRIQYFGRKILELQNCWAIFFLLASNGLSTE